MTDSVKRSYGWIRGERSPTDKVYGLLKSSEELPPQFRLVDGMPPVYDQGETNSCTAHAWAGVYEYQLAKQNLPVFMPSRLFIYYNERLYEGTTNSDSGATAKDGARALTEYGTLPESYWQFNEPVTARPPQSDYDLALPNVVTSYSAVNQDELSIKTALHNGHPIVFGFDVYPALESDAVAANGILPMPDANAESIGGHAAVLVGWDDPTQTFWVRNSWGRWWGQDGYFQMPYAYVLNTHLASDFWIIQSEK